MFSNGQYSLTTTLTTYQPLNMPISLNNGTVWNEGGSFPIYLSFNFHIYGQTYTTLNVQTGGGMSFPGLGANQLFVYHTPFGGYMLKDKGTSTSISPINYEITGTTGQNILKVEWQNAGFVNWYTTSDSTDFVDLQIWLFETDNHIEIHFGNNQTDPGTYGYPVGTSDSNPGPNVKLSFDACSNILCVTGAANLPSYGFYNLCSPNYYFIDGTPSLGITYNFYPTSSVGISEITTEQLNIFPNPFSEQTSIDFFEEQKNTTIKIMDIIGKEIKSIVFSGKQLTIEKGEMKAGIYFVQTTNEKKIICNKKIIIQ